MVCVGYKYFQRPENTRMKGKIKLMDRMSKIAKKLSLEVENFTLLGNCKTYQYELFQDIRFNEIGIRICLTANHHQ